MCAYILGVLRDWMDMVFAKMRIMESTSRIRLCYVTLNTITMSLFFNVSFHKVPRISISHNENNNSKQAYIKPILLPTSQRKTRQSTSYQFPKSILNIDFCGINESLQKMRCE